MNKFIAILAAVFLSGCATAPSGDEIARQRAEYWNQMAKEEAARIAQADAALIRGCTPGNTCIPKVLKDGLPPEESRHRKAYATEHTEVNKIAAAVKDCASRNQARRDHGLPPVRDCRDLLSSEMPPREMSREEIEATNRDLDAVAREARRGTSTPEVVYVYEYTTPAPRVTVELCEWNRYCGYQYPSQRHYHGYMGGRYIPPSHHRHRRH